KCASNEANFLITPIFQQPARATSAETVAIMSAVLIAPNTPQRIRTASDFMIQEALSDSGAVPVVRAFRDAAKLYLLSRACTVSPLSVFTTTQSDCGLQEKRSRCLALQ